jgi:transcriptional regulator with XRE-family HTH domain
VDEKTISRRLAEIRRSRGLTQVELAAKLGLNQPLVSQYERGDIRMHASLVAAFAKALRVSSDELLGLQPSKRNGLPKTGASCAGSRRSKRCLAGTGRRYSGRSTASSAADVKRRPTEHARA